MTRSVACIAAVFSVLVAEAGHGGFISYTNYDEWQAATSGPITTIDFVFPESQFLNTQYASFGLIFPEGEEVAVPAGIFDLDGWGAKGSALGDDEIHLQFLTPQNWLGVWFPGHVQASFYSAGQLIYTSPEFFSGTPDVAFGGVVSNIAFDEVILDDPSGGIFIDNLEFGGAAIPAPSGCALLVALMTFGQSRRRALPGRLH